jgi:hypothetical protein
VKARPTKRRVATSRSQIGPKTHCSLDPTAWKTSPPWFAVATGDNAIHLDMKRFYAKRPA